MKSMTGFGVGEANLGDGRLVVEMRSVNHRYLDVRVRLAPELAEHAVFLEQLAREALERGRYDVGLRLEGAAVPPPTLSRARVRALYRDLTELAHELTPGTPIPLSAVLGLPDVLETRGFTDPVGVRERIAEALGQARRSLDEMRLLEGASLARDLAARLATTRQLVAELGENATKIVDAHRERLRGRVARLLSSQSFPVDSGRLELEVALLADRSDVTEELVRLGSHFDQFEALLGLDEPIGRRLDFLLQEVSREVNTLGSKSQDVAVAFTVVALKAEVERMREQVQNVE